MTSSKSLLGTIALLTALASLIRAAPTAEELIETNCASCHLLTLPNPQMMTTFKAPAMDAVLFHLKAAMKDDEKKMKEFIIDYTQNPVVSKSVCESNKVQKFGVMPSLKGKVSPENLSTIADYMIKMYPSKTFIEMINEIKTNDKLNSLKNSPFLMNQDALPHLTKILIEHWEKDKLGLTKEQKTKLLTLRIETMSGVAKIKKKLNSLEIEVIEMIVDGEERKEIQPKVEEIGKLKTQATMIHIKCLQESIEILNDEQIEFLLPFWDI